MFNEIEYTDSSEIFDAWQGKSDFISAWLYHGKFAQWLIYKLQPRSLVELGSHFGFSYFTFCKTIKRLNVPCEAVAVDTWGGWGGEFQSGKFTKEYWDDVYKNVQKMNEEYSNFSKLLRMAFDDAVHLVPDNSVDLLHIDGCHKYEAVANDWKKWKPKLTKDGVVLFHDTNVRNSKRNFGVWRLFEEIGKDWHTFEFLHCFGLGIASKNPDTLPELFHASKEQVEEIRKFFDEENE